MDLEPELVADTRCHTGEGPLYHPGEDAVYWVDIPNGQLFRHDPATAAEYEQVLDLDGAIGGYTIQTDGSLLLFRHGGLVQRFDSGSLETVIDGIPGEEDTRFNDVIADPKGRVYAGTMPTDEELGDLYRFDTDGSYEVVEPGVDIPNGMGFTLDNRSMYFTESEAHTVDLFDYDEATGGLSNRRTFVATDPDDGVPDGMTVDTEGYVWSARWNGGRLVRYAPDGSVDAEVEFPARKVSSVTFGGPDYTTMYVTLAGGDDREAEGEGAGALFRVETNVQGIREHYSAVQV